MSSPKPRLSALTYLGFSINCALEAGHKNVLSFNEIYDALEEGKILEFLDQKIPDEFDFSLFPKGGDQSIALNSVINDAAMGLRGRERKKTGIEECGLHLLMSYTLEAIQRKDWV